MIKLYSDRREDLRKFFKNQKSESLRLRFCRHMTNETIDNYVDNSMFGDNSCVNAIIEDGQIIAIIESFFGENALGFKTIEVALMVDENHRHRGLGKKLFSSVLDRMEEHGSVIKSHCMRSNCWMTKICIDHGLKIETFGTEIVATRVIDEIF